MIYFLSNKVSQNFDPFFDWMIYFPFSKVWQNFGPFLFEEKNFETLIE